MKLLVLTALLIASISCSDGKSPYQKNDDSFTPLCNRSQNVFQDTLQKLGKECHEVTETELASLKHIYVTGKNLTEIRRSDLQGMTNLNHFVMDTNNKPVRIDEDLFADIKNLKRIEIRGVKDYPRDLLRGLAQLKELSLVNGKMVEVPNLSDLPNLTSLSLANNLFTSTDFLRSADLSKIEILDLAGNRLKVFRGKDIKGQRYLKKLNLSYNEMEGIEGDSFYGLTQLIGLRLNHNPIQQVSPQAFYSLKSLRSLYIDGTRLKHFPFDAFQRDSDLETLWARSGRISEVSVKISDFFPHLKILDMSGNQIATLAPDCFAELTQLETISFGGNRIREIKTGQFISTNSLRRFAFGNNRLIDFDVDILDHQTELESVYLKSNDFSLEFRSQLYEAFHKRLGLGNFDI